MGINDPSAWRVFLLHGLICTVLHLTNYNESVLKHFFLLVQFSSVSQISKYFIHARTK